MLGFEGSTSEQKISRRIISINTGVDGIFYPPSPLKSPKKQVIAMGFMKPDKIVSELSKIVVL